MPGFFLFLNVCFSITIIIVQVGNCASEEQWFTEKRPHLLVVPNKELIIQLDHWKNLTFHPSGPLAESVTLCYVSKGKKEYIHFLQPCWNLTRNSTKEVQVTVRGKKVTGSHFIKERNIKCIVQNITGNSSCPLDLSDFSLQYRVVHSRPLYVVILVVGWIYFAAWSISFYPQCWLNFRRKSVKGLNFDFLALNITGFLCYSVYNCVLYWSDVALRQYKMKYPDSTNPVLLNDVFFSVHAVILCCFTILQCLMYDRGHQRVSRLAMLIVSAMWLFNIICMVLEFADVITLLMFINLLSYVKLAVTLIKYIPQAYMNYKRKSTVGWSIGNVLLDFTGGSMSLLQMFLLAYNRDDWVQFFGDFTKFGLGFFSLLFDILFIAQHYVLYRGSEPYEEEAYPEIINDNSYSNYGANSVDDNVVSVGTAPIEK